MRNRAVCAAICAVMFPAALAQAALTYSYASNQTSYNVAPSGTVTVTVSIREIVTGGSQSLFAPTAQGGHGGLFSSGVKLDRNGASLPSNPTSITDAATNGAFNDAFVFNNSKTITAASGKFTNAAISTPVAATDLGGGVWEVVLGTFTLTAGSVPGQTTEFFITDYDNYGSSGDTVTGQGTTLDVTGGTSPSIASFTVTTSPVPDPSGGVLLLVPVAALLRRRPRAV